MSAAPAAVEADVDEAPAGQQLVLVGSAVSGVWGCGRCGGRGGRRRRSVETTADLVVCDLCWHAAGGAAGVRARAEADAPLVVLDPRLEAVLAEAEALDALSACSTASSAWRHALDRLLIDSGVRWSLLRRIRPAARVDLAARVAGRVAPGGTRRAVSPGEWMDAVDARIAAQRGTFFRYACKAATYRDVAGVWAAVADVERRPLAWVAQQEIAATLGVDPRTVRRALVWLQGEGLLHELVPGCRVPEADVPEAETPAERAQRLAADEGLAAEAERAAAVEAARQALVEAELAAVRAGLYGADAAAAALASLSPEQTALLAAEPAPPQETRLLQVVPVYELRVPLTEAELAEEAALVSATEPDLDDPGDPSGSDVWPVWDVEGVTCGDTENVHPPQNLYGAISSTGAGAVDEKRGAARRSDQRSCPGAWSGQVEGGGGGAGSAVDGLVDQAEGDEDPGRATPTVPVAATLSSGGTVVRAGDSTDPAAVAAWLARSALDPRLVEGQDLDLLERWLRKMLQATGLLQMPGWDGAEVHALLHGRPVFPNLPYDIASPRAFLRRRFQQAEPLLPPSKLAEVHRIERGSRYYRDHRLGVHSTADPYRVEMTARRAAIDACGLCDEQGWIDDLGPDVPVVRCNHDPATGGW